MTPTSNACTATNAKCNMRFTTAQTGNTIEIMVDLESTTLADVEEIMRERGELAPGAHLSFGRQCDGVDTEANRRSGGGQAKCAWCGEGGRKEKKLRTCGQCKVASYCDAKCQAADWKAGHKKRCKELALAHEK